MCLPSAMAFSSEAPLVARCTSSIAPVYTAGAQYLINPKTNMSAHKNDWPPIPSGHVCKRRLVRGMIWRCCCQLALEAVVQKRHKKGAHGSSDHAPLRLSTSMAGTQEVGLQLLQPRIFSNFDSRSNQRHPEQLRGSGRPRMSPTPTEPTSQPQNYDTHTHTRHAGVAGNHRPGDECGCRGRHGIQCRSRPPTR